MAQLSCYVTWDMAQLDICCDLKQLFSNNTWCDKDYPLCSKIIIVLAS